jgi:hypothetical protein
MGLFSPRPQTTTAAKVEERHGKLALISTAARGTLRDVRSRRARQARLFQIPHVPYYQTIMADDIQNIRAFGSETDTELVSQVVTEELTGMRRDHETTHEWHRLGALKGIVLDADASSVIYNFFTEWGITQNTDTISFVTPDNIKAKAQEWIRSIADNIGGSPLTGHIALCGDQFFDAVVTAAEVVSNYDRWRESFANRVTQLGPDFAGSSMSGLDYADIMFTNYRGKIGDVAFVDPTKAYVFPVGVPDMFVGAIAPADMIGATNTMGQLLYASQEPLDHNKGVELHTQSNVLYINTYPRGVIEVTGTFS